MPLSIYFVVFNIAPFFVAILTYFWLNEVISKLELVTMVFAFGGVIMVGLSKKDPGNNDPDTAQQITNGLYTAGIILCLANSFGTSVSIVATRRLKMLSVIVIQWYYALTSCLVTGISVWLQKKSFYTAFTETGWHEWLFILSIGILNNLGQNLMTCINQRANPATASIMMYFGIGFSFIFDVLLFKISFTPLQLIGTGICLSFTAMTAIYKQYCMPATKK